MRIHPTSRAFLGLTVAVLFLALGGCTTDSPTEPRQTPPPASGGGGGSAPATWNVTLTSSRPQLEVNGTRSATITVRVREASNNALPPDGAVVTVTTSLGEFVSPGSGATSVLLSLLQGSASVLLFPGDEPGNAVVTARFDQSFGQINVPIVVVTTPIDTPTPVPDTFFLDRVEPDQGSPAGGEIVRILGQEIVEPVRVFFGGLPAEVLSVSSTTIRVVTPRNDSVPPAGRLPVDVEVTINVNNVGEQTDTLVQGFVYTREDVELQPEIFSVTPNIGPNEGGTRVTINGDGFQSPVQVLFEGPVSLEAQVESITRTQIVVLSPSATGFGAPNQNQTVGITVRNLNNGLTATRASAFRYGVQFAVFGVDPAEGPHFGGTRVTIFGEGFDEPLVVDFGTVRQQVLSVSGNEILVRTSPLFVDNSCTDPLLPVLVTHLETNQTAGGGNVNFRYLVRQFAPRITSTSPTILSQSPGSVTINGANFNLPLEVTFNGRPVILTSVSATQLVGTFPDIPNGDFDENPCNDNGDSQEGQRFVVTPFELLVTDLDTSCTATLTVNVQPSDTSCRNDIAPTPVPPTSTPAPTSTPQPTAQP